jgi:glucosyl-3-phosphoglycerate synthase
MVVPYAPPVRQRPAVRPANALHAPCVDPAPDGYDAVGMSGEHDQEGPSTRTFHHADFPAAKVLEAKAGRTVSVCIPARDEGSTVGSVVRAVVQPFLASAGGNGLVDEVIVLDDSSTDDTAAQAVDAGARVVHGVEVGGGKGQAMAAALAASSGDVVVFLDADVANTTPAFVTGMLGPLLFFDDIALVKGFYTRPLHGDPTGGGRVTELVARPVLELLFPALSDVRQPLAGETAAHRWVFEKVNFADGYGVEIGLLIDVAQQLGAGVLAQVDLGVRIHRNRPLHELRPQATDVLRAALSRAPR